MPRLTRAIALAVGARREGIMIPQRLSDWTLDAIGALLLRHGLENDRVEWKRQLPAKQDTAGKLRLRRTCAAFANSGGGFLVFGIDDGRKKTIEERIVGLDADLEFGEHFAPYPGGCTPSVDWDFLNPPIEVPGEGVIHVVWIHDGWRPPYGVQIQSGAWEFDKRTSGGNERMSYEEMAMKFQHERERVTKVELLLRELRLMREMTVLAVEDQRMPAVSHFMLEVVESLLPDVFPIIQREDDLIDNLYAVRIQARHMESMLRKLALDMSVNAVVGHPEGALQQAQLGKLRLTSAAFVDCTDGVIHKLERLLAQSTR